MNQSKACFTAIDDSETELEFVFDFEKQKPVKIGDGSFGSVFRIKKGDELFAIKLFYHSSDKKQIQRYITEMNAGKKIRNGLRSQELTGLEANLVLPIASSETFLESQAAKTLQPWFEQAGLSVSNYCLVMELYECTLKELLEHGAPKGRLLSGQICRVQGIPGYEILAEQSMQEREKTILPIISQTASGLRALHAANMFHHDLKPANILLRSKGNLLEAAVADLGFLQPNHHLGTQSGGNAASMPLGTRHYRAPEQKDYFDVCEVDIVDSGGQPHLVTTDRKFRDTLIESGDLLYFSKDPARIAHEISAVTHENVLTKIELIRPKVALQLDERTQVVMYKMHSAKTDIFGVGALIFDLLTCGRSPERFYDYLRPYDKFDSSDPKTANMIQSLIGKYKQVEKSHATNAETATLFLQLKDERHKYPSHESIKIMLKCLLSAAEDSYFGIASSSSKKRNIRLELFNKIGEELSEVTARKDAFGYGRVENPLWMGGSDTESPSRQFPTFANLLAEIKKIPRTERGLRLILANDLFKKLFNAVVEFKNQQSQYFAEISPSGIQFDSENGKLSIVGKTYSDLKQYDAAVRTGDAVGLEGDDDRDNMVPPYRRFMSRSAIVSSLPDGEQVETFVLSYLDSCPCWDLNCGEFFVRYKGSTGEHSIARINWNSECSRHVSFESNTKLDLDESSKVTIFRFFQPANYFLSMLGIYVHQLFFADDVYDCGAIPDAIWFSLQAKASGFPVFDEKELDLVAEKWVLDLKDYVDSNQETLLQRKIDDYIDTYLGLVYYWLVALQFQKKGKTNDDELFAIAVDIKKRIQELIAIRVGVKSSVLEIMQINWNSKDSDSWIDNPSLETTGEDYVSPLDEVLTRCIDPTESLFDFGTNREGAANLRKPHDGFFRRFKRIVTGESGTN